MSRDRSKDAPKSAAELMAELRQDRAFLERERALKERQNAHARAYGDAAQGVLADLRDAGFSVSTIGELRNGARRYKKAVPVLMRWLPRVSEQQVKEDIVRTLSVPWAKDASPALLAEYRKPENESNVRWAIANALEVMASPEIFGDLVALVLDPNGGQPRQMLALAIAKTKAQGASDALMQLLDDEQVAGHAISGLAKLNATVPRERVEPFLRHPAAWVRKEAKKLL